MASLQNRLSFNCKLSVLSTKTCNRYKIFISKAFHNSKFSSAHLSPAVIRQKKNRYRALNANLLNDKINDGDESLPPIRLLEIAHKTGVLDMEPKQVILFLRQYQNCHNHSQISNWQQELFTEFNINSPKTMTLIAAILRRCKTKAQQSFARTLMLSASAMGDKMATFEIISSALRSNAIRNYQEVLARLEKLALNKDQQAMMLLGKVLFYTNQSDSKALSWLRKANYPPTGNLNFDGAGESLVLEGRILQKIGDLSNARIAFERAAKELNDPEAYFYLSQMEEKASLIQQTYLLKAATAGISEACHNLGVIELEKMMQDNPNPKKLEDFGMAREWFLVAAHDGNGLSMLNLAIMCKIIQNWTQAFEWLEKAQSVPNVYDEAKKMWHELKCLKEDITVLSS
ncbi:hypothetical protein HI914_04539 [Erysiphe necator]|nr:hypothetical protein HI914_04539 [Erysiphe necator]